MSQPSDWTLEELEQPKATEVGELFEVLVKIMSILRSDKGCPWDREQTHATLLSHLIEEAYEVVEAVNQGDLKELQGELGDLLLHVVFHAQLAAENSDFHIGEVIGGIRDKLIRRHPHVFGDQKGEAQDADDVKKIWSEAKRKEGKKSLLSGIPKGMPALQSAWRIGDKTNGVGFDWQDANEVCTKVEEEFGELKEAMHKEDTQHTLEEYGDLLFTVVQLGRHLQMDPELALRQANDKFKDRFEKMEQASGGKLAHLNRDQLETMWNQAKEK